MTIIQAAKKLVAEHGKKHAIQVFKKQIEEIGEPKSLQDVCNISGNETAIEWINENFK